METNESTVGNQLSKFSSQITAAVENVAGSIVAIDARPRVATSGVLWREGIVVSTNHTVRRDENITVALEGGKTVAATLVGRDAGTDLAVLKIDDEETAKTLKPAEISESAAVKVGNVILAVGRTSAESGVSASFGIVNAVGGRWQTWRGNEIEQFIGLDSSIYLGFSGGALVNPAGQILGINTSAFGRGLALTIPAQTVNRVVDVLLAKGTIVPAFLGIGTQAVPLSENLRQKLNLAQPSGLMMLTIETDGPAEKAGALIGDVLLSINNEQTLEPIDVQSMLSRQTAGNVVNAKVLRGGELREIQITLGERPARETEEQGRGRGRGRRGWR
jgi:S1-C subfamily serine protease